MNLERSWTWPNSKTNSKEADMQMGEALDHFLVQLRADGRSRHTVSQYERHVRLLSRWAARMSFGSSKRPFPSTECSDFSLK